MVSEDYGINPTFSRCVFLALPYISPMRPISSLQECKYMRRRTIPLNSASPIQWKQVKTAGATFRKVNYLQATSFKAIIQGNICVLRNWNLLSLNYIIALLKIVLFYFFRARACSWYSISQEICTRFCCALLCCGYAIVHNEFTSSIYPYSSGLLCWHCGNR